MMNGREIAYIGLIVLVTLALIGSSSAARQAVYSPTTWF